MEGISYKDVIQPLLPPANEVCEGYVFTPVCHSVHGGGGDVCLSACWDTPPGADIVRHAVRYWQQAGGTHPTGMHTC